MFQILSGIQPILCKADLPKKKGLLTIYVNSMVGWGSPLQGGWLNHVEPQNPPRAVANDSDPRWTVDNEFTFGMDPTVELLEMEARSQWPGKIRSRIYPLVN